MKFRYKALNDQGKPVTGVTDAPDNRVAAASLREQKLTPIIISPIKDSVDLSIFTQKFERVSTTEITNFTRQLSTMLTAGLPLTDALNLLKVQSSAHFSPAISGLLIDVQGGKSLSESMSKHPDIFSKVYISLIKAGEAAGIVETILARLAESLEKSREFTNKVKSALVYPVIVVVGMIGVIIVMMVFVVPKLTTLYSQFNTELPLATRLVVGMSNLTINFWWLGVLLAAGGFMALKTFISTNAGRKKWDAFLFKLPIAGSMLEQVMITELTRTLSLLVGAGVSIVEALNIVSEALGNLNVEEEVKRIAKRVEKGFPVSVSFTESGQFPPIVGQMIAVGEETGKMDEVLIKLSKYYEGESEQRVKGLTTAIEPLIIILLGGGVGFLVFSIIMPIYSIMDSF